MGIVRWNGMLHVYLENDIIIQKYKKRSVLLMSELFSYPTDTLLQYTKFAVTADIKTETQWEIWW